MSEQGTARAEFDLIDLMDMTWKSRRLIGVITLLFLVMGMVVYFAIPASYRAEVEITPLTRAKFADYADLVAASRFGYTREALAAEFVKYLTDRNRLALAEKEAGVVGARVDFKVKEGDPPKQGEARTFISMQMTATYDNEERLNAFMSGALKHASRDIAIGIREEIERRVAADEEAMAWGVKRTNVLIAAEREKVAAERHDDIAKLKKEALVARSVGLDRPLELRAQTLTIDRFAPTPTVQQPASPERPVQPALSYPKYFDGYLALEEQANILENRKDDDPYIPHLRDMQKEIFVLKNDVSREQVSALLARSALSKPDQAESASYSLAEASARKVFPKMLIVVPTALLLGLFFGIAGAVVRGVRTSKASFTPS